MLRHVVYQTRSQGFTDFQRYISNRPHDVLNFLFYALKLKKVKFSYSLFIHKPSLIIFGQLLVAWRERLWGEEHAQVHL